MATNKRKDAAALFELIDKSTLKVPKGGSLKIPSWWSSKTNGAGPGVAGGASRVGVGMEDEDGGVPAASVDAPAKVPAPRVEVTKKEAPAPLFDPPPADAEVDVSPSIRPPSPESLAPGSPVSSADAASPATSDSSQAPVASSLQSSADAEAGAVSAPVSPTIVAPAPAIAATVAGAESKPVRAANHAGGAKPVSKRFAPQTVSQESRQGWTPPSFNAPGLRLARAPGWVLVAGAAAVFLIVLLVVFLALPGNNKPTSSQPGASSAGNSNDTPRPDATDPRNPGGDALTGRQAPSGGDAAIPAKARVYGPGELQRDPSQYYIWILCTPKEEMAKKDAQFIAASGVGVSIEIQQASSGKLLWQLISEQGFPSVKAAEPYLKRVREIGRLTPEYKKTRRTSDAWDDAFVQKVKPAAR